MGLWRKHWTCRNASTLKGRNGIRNWGTLSKSLSVQMSGTQNKPVFTSFWGPSEINWKTSLASSNTKVEDEDENLGQIFVNQSDDSLLFAPVGCHMEEGWIKGFRKWEWSWLTGHCHPQVGPPYLWVLHPRIKSTMNWKYLGETF